MRFYKHLTRRP